MELLGREGWFWVGSTAGCLRIQGERKEKKRRKHCSSACLQPTQAKKQEKSRSKQLHGCRDRSSGRRMRENWKEIGARALSWWSGVRVCVEQTESKRRASLIHQPHQEDNSKEGEKMQPGPPARNVLRWFATQKARVPDQKSPKGLLYNGHVFRPYTEFKEKNSEAKFVE